MKTREIIDFVHDLKYEDLPDNVVEHAKKCFLDSLGCMLGASQTSMGETFIDFAKENTAKGDSTVIGDGYKTSSLFASFVNSALSNVLDFDDTGFGHTGSIIIPAALSVAEDIEANGKELILSIVVGYEVASRASSFLRTETPSTVDHWMSITAGTTTQTNGAAATASKLLGLNKDEINNSFGIVTSTAPCPGHRKKREIGGIRPTIKASYGWASMMGILAALMAKGGLTAVLNAFDGNLGIFSMREDRTSGFFENMTDGLGEKFAITQFGFKPYSCCRHYHTTLDGTFSIMSEENVQVEDIESVTIKARTLLTDGDHDIRRPQSPTDAQFSGPYIVATALVNGKVIPDLFTEEEIRNPKTLEVLDKISFIADPRFDPPGRGIEVQIQTVDGKTFRRTVLDPKGSNENPMSDKEFKDKFRSLALTAVTPEKTEQIIKITEKLEELEKMSSLTKLLC